MACSVADRAGSSRWGVLLACVRLPVDAASPSRKEGIAGVDAKGSVCQLADGVEVSQRQPVGDAGLPLSVRRRGHVPSNRKCLTISDIVGPWSRGAHKAF